jgi:hypothetical protein
MGFFPESPVNHPSWGNSIPSPGLRGAVEQLSVKAKQAFYVVLKSGGIMHRSTWNGCAFNAGGRAIGRQVDSFEAAARAFDMKQSDVTRFIRLWDNSRFPNDETASRYLFKLLDQVGICTPPKGKGKGPRIIRGYVYKGEATKFQEQLESGELTVDMIPGCKEAAELLTCNA